MRLSVRIVGGLLLIVWCLSALPASAQGKRVAILYFEDDSGFDSPAGCGFIPLGPLGRLFGKTKKQREDWNLEVGFRDLFVTTIQDSPGYEIVTPDEVMVAFAELGVSKRDLRRKDVRLSVADKVRASVLVTATIRKFRQERARGIIERDISGSGAAAVISGGGSLSTSVGAAANFYRASVSTEFVVYGVTGDEAFAANVEKSENYQGGTFRSGPLQASVSDDGARALVGSQEIISPGKVPPVVRHEVLEHVKFGTPGWDAPRVEDGPPNFRQTLLGQVTQEVMTGFVARMRDQIGPSLEEVTPPADAAESIGKVILNPENSTDFYVNLGTAAGLRPGDRLRLLRPGEEIRDIDTGEVLGTFETEIGSLDVVEVLRPKLSRTRVASGEARVGDIVKTIPPQPEPTGSPAPEESRP